MEIKVNKDVRKFEEEFFMGMNFRKALFTVIIAIVGLIIGLGLRKRVSMETISWIIPVAVIPLVIIGFKNFQGLPFEKFFFIYCRHKFFMQKKLTLGNDNYMRTIRENIKKEENIRGKKEKNKER